MCHMICTIDNLKLKHSCTCIIIQLSMRLTICSIYECDVANHHWVSVGSLALECDGDLTAVLTNVEH